MHVVYMLYRVIVVVTCMVHACLKCMNGTQGQRNRGWAGGYTPPPTFQICELGGLASHCVKLGTLACNTTHI